MPHSIMEKKDDGYFIVGSRVPLDTVVYLWRDGLTDQMIQEAYPSLDLREVRGAIDFYLTNRADIDPRMEQCEREEDAVVARMAASAPEFLRRLQSARIEP